MRAGLLGTRVVHVDGEWEGIVPDEFITMVTPSLRKYDDANFIAHAREDVPALLALVREQAATLDAIAALAEGWRYKGEFGWGAWQEGHGPDPEGSALDHAAGQIRAALEVKP